MRLRFYFILLGLLAQASLGQATGVVNGDFETGSVSPWNVNTGTGGYATSYPYAQVVSSGVAPNTNGALQRVDSGNYSLELYSGVGDSYHADYASVSQDFYVDPTTTMLQFNVAAVLNGAHASTPGEDAYFEADILSGATLLMTQRYYYASSPAPLVDDGVPGWKHLPWTNINFSLGAYVGTTLTVEFSAHDCNQGGHDNWAYVDGFALVPTFTISPTFSVSPTITLTPTAPIPGQTDTLTPTRSPSASITVSSTRSPTPSITPSFSASPSHTVSPTLTVTPTFSETPTFTDSPTVTETRTITLSFTASPSFTHSPTVSPTPSITPTFSYSPTPVNQAGPVDIRNVYPNPFSDKTHLVMVMKGPGVTEILIYNVAGEPVYTERRPMVAGVNIWDWAGINDARARLATGVYLVRARVIDDPGPPSFLMIAIAR